jgi:hypothetical protein
MGSFDKATFLRAARFAHIAEAFAEVHWGPQASSWQGSLQAGELCFDNGQGDVLAMAWDAGGLVGLALDHEQGGPALSFPDHGARGFFAEIPVGLVALVRGASQWGGGEFTTAFWALGEGPLEGAWREAIALVLPSLDFAFAPQSLETWAEQRSLDPAQVALALRLARGPWEVRLGPEETQQIMQSPLDAGPPESREAVERAAAMLSEVGVIWAPPLEVVAANLASHGRQRRERAVQALGELNATLFERVREGDAARVTALLAAGANVDAQTVDDQFEWTPAGDTPLLQAVKQGHEEVVESLLAGGANVESANSFGQSALYWAVRKGLIRTFTALHARGASLDRADSSGWTPLHMAAADGLEELVTLLLRHGADRESRNQNGHRPIDVARLRRQEGVIRVLETG